MGSILVSLIRLFFIEFLMEMAKKLAERFAKARIKFHEHRNRKKKPHG